MSSQNVAALILRFIGLLGLLYSLNKLLIVKAPDATAMFFWAAAWLLVVFLSKPLGKLISTGLRD